MPRSNNRRPADEVMAEIHELVNMDLVSKLTDTIKDYVEEHGSIKTNVVSATFAYMVADAISQDSSHDDICVLAETYSVYIHRVAHGLAEAEALLVDVETETLQ